MSLTDRLNELDRELTARERLWQERKARHDAIVAECEALDKESSLLDKVEQVLQAVSSRVLGQSTSAIDKLVTAGLKAVFFDQKLEFKTTVDKYRGKTSIRFDLFEDGQSAPLTESYGGGVLVMVGVLLRLVTIMILDLRRILLLDESLSHLSEQYHQTASETLKKLCQELGFTILMVTHADSLAASATKQYNAVRKNGATEFILK